MTLIKTITPQPQHEARLAREKLHLEGEVPNGVLRAEIDASWRRSLSHGVHFNGKHELALESSASLEVFPLGNAQVRLQRRSLTPELLRESVLFQRPLHMLAHQL